MHGRLSIIAGAGGVVAAHGLAALPSYTQLAGLVMLALSALVFVRKRCGPFAWLFMAAVLGFAGTALWAQARLNQRLAPLNVDRVVRVTLRIESLPRLQPDQVSFEARVLQAHPAGVPNRIRVVWGAPGWRGPYAAPRSPDPPFPELHAGQVWRMALVMRPLGAAQNFHAFDYERHTFAINIRAIGRVRGTPEFLRQENWARLSIMAERARHAVRKATDPYLNGRRYGAVLRALAIGDQDGVADEDWQVFNRSGLTHLVSISGSHITLLSAAAALAVAALWRRLRWKGRYLAERWPARRAAACAALIVAWLYCLLAGWGVPARRTFLMLAVVAGAQALQLRVSGSRVLALAALAVLATDPWAILASGFWLSFMAVAVLLAVGADHVPPHQELLQERAGADSLGSRLRLAAWLQWAVTWALCAPLAWIFHEVSLVSPFANAYAIPMIELIVTPLSLALAAVAFIPGLEILAQAIAALAHGVLWALMQPTQWLAGLPTVPVPVGPAWLYGLACLGVLVALWPRARAPWGRRRAYGWLALLPMVLWPPARPAAGEWTLHAFDVGQGSAVLLQTARHALLFDTGARHARDSDEGRRTILPALQALGVKRVDVLVVSHADLDHAGGTRSILQGVPVGQVYSSFALAPWLQGEAHKLGEPTSPAVPLATFCRFGTHWEIDGVHFEFLWPLDVRPLRPGRLANAGSCVLKVTGRHHGLLLTGDIEADGEARLVKRGLSRADVVIAAHHGSRTSSSAGFIHAIRAGHAIIQAGRWNRHGHPHPAVLARWRKAGTVLWRTDRQGAIRVQSHAGGLRLHGALESAPRYWHADRP